MAYPLLLKLFMTNGQPNSDETGHYDMDGVSIDGNHVIVSGTDAEDLEDIDDRLKKAPPDADRPEN